MGAKKGNSMFKVGETWTAPGAAFTLTVQSATTEGFVVTVTRGNPNALFYDGFNTAP